MRKLAYAGLCALALAGCAGMFFKPTATARINCAGDQCTDLFQRAQVWIAKNSSYRIQIMNDSIIQTYGPEEYSDAVAFTVTKEKTANGGQIVITGACYGTVYGCSFDPSIQTNQLFFALNQTVMK